MIFLISSNGIMVFSSLPPSSPGMKQADEKLIINKINSGLIISVYKKESPLNCIGGKQSQAGLHQLLRHCVFRFIAMLQLALAIRLIYLLLIACLQIVVTWYTRVLLQLMQQSAVLTTAQRLSLYNLFQGIFKASFKYQSLVSRICLFLLKVCIIRK